MAAATGSSDEAKAKAGDSAAEVLSDDEISSKTAEGVPIVKLYISNLPKRATKKILHKIFSQYGTVECTNPMKKPHTDVHAFVTFSDPKDAVKARKAATRKEVKYNDKELRVVPANIQQASTDNPPKPSTTKKQNSKKQKKPQDANNSQSKNSKTNKPTFIHMLDDDCLHKIFMELPIKDRMRIERVCKRWQNVSEQAWPDIKDLHLTQNQLWSARTSYGSSKPMHLDHLDNRSVEKVLMRCGRFVSRLSLVSKSLAWTPDFLLLIAEHCYNVTKLVLNLEKYPKKEMGKLFSKCQKLKYIEMNNLGKDFTGDCLHKLPKETVEEIYLEARVIEDYTFSTCFRNLTRPAVDTLRKVNNLHTLKLNGFSFKPERLKPISEIQTLTNVSFANCSLKKSITVLGNLVNLENLNLYKVPEVSNELLTCLAKNCLQLKHLNISHCAAVSSAGIAEIAKLPSIESLLMNDLFDVSDESLWRMTTLKTLQCENCDGVYDNGIIKLIETAPNLEYLNLYSTGISLATLQTANKVTRRRDGLVLRIVVSASIMEDYDEEEPSPFLLIEEKDDSLWDNYYGDSDDLDDDEYDQEDDDSYGDGYDLDDFDFDYVGDINMYHDLD